MKESQKRIKLFRDSLPATKQKVLASLLLFIMSAAILITYTYAWFTMSRAPEATKISTSISANGNLEIALCTDNAAEPGSSQIGDSVSVDGNLVRSNTSWGNVINLYDDYYGISNVTLRPAQLNTAGLNSSPLWGAVYSGDGRIETLDSDYAFFTWDNGTFLHTGKYGVRAIGTYTTGIAGSTDQEYDRLKQDFIQKHNDINKSYTAVMDNNEYGLPKLSNLLVDVAQDAADLLYARLMSRNKTSAKLDRQRIEDMLTLYQELINLMETEHTAQLVALANFQQFVYVKNSNNPALVYQPFSWADLEANQAKYNANSPSQLSQDKNVSLPGLTAFINDLKTLKSDMALLSSYLADPDAVFYFDKRVAQSGDIIDSPLVEHEYDIEPIANRLLNYNNAVVHDKDGNVTTDVTVGVLLSSGSYAMNWSSVKNATLTFTNCALQRFELYALDSARLNGTENSKERFKLNVSVSIARVNMTCDLFTAADETASFSYIQSAFDKAVSQKLVANDAIVKDTYGLAVDFWLRSNASINVLLAGATAIDEQSGTVMRYDGINRVWNRDEDAGLTNQSTTQGGGSCYVYYADTPEDGYRSLNLLSALKIAFVDTDGNLVASAYMDTDHYWAQNGKYTVPFVLSGTDAGVLSLRSGVATRLTALIYLDGNLLTNDDVLAVNTIQGLLNLQFQSDADLNAMDDEDLYYQTHSVSASVSRTEMDFSLNEGADLTTNIKVKVDGESPKTVEAFFLRAINNSQGSREKTMTFVYNEGSGEWETTYRFTSPGTFWLRTVRLDGIDYALTEPITVTVKGYSVADVTWGEADKTAVHYLTGNSYSTKVGIRLGSDDRSILPKGLSAIFVDENGTFTTTKLTYNGVNDTWEGTASFSQSGVYTLQYALTDTGLYLDLAEHNADFAKTLTLYLDIYAVVSNNGGALENEYTGETFYKDVTVRFFDGNHTLCTPHVVTDGEGNVTVTEGSRIVLYYKIVGTAYYADTDLTWNNDLALYTGQLGLTKAGRYELSHVTVSGQDDPITEDAAASCKYRITPAGGVTMLPSTGHYNTSTQVTLRQRAYVGPIKLKNASEKLLFTVKNNTSGLSYDIPYDPSVTDPAAGYVEQGAIDGNTSTWYVYLPSEDLNGKWTLEKIELWDCYDESGSYHPDDGSNNLVWESPDYDFSALSTYVTTNVVIALSQGAASVGNGSVDFYTQQTLIGKDTYAVITYRDENGNVCTYDDQNDPGLKLNISYTAPTDATYGYKLKANPHANFSVSLDFNENGRWTVDKAYPVWAVGEYKATLTAGSGNFSIENGTCTYKVYSDAPRADDLSYSLGSTLNTASTHKGAFLDSYTPNLSVPVTFKLKNGSEYPTQYVEMPTGITQELTTTLTYKTNSLNIAMDFNPCEEVVYTMNDNDNDSRFTPTESKPLVPGIYAVAVTLKINGATASTIVGEDITVSLRDNALPTLSVKDVSKGRENRYRGNGTHFSVNALVYDFDQAGFISSNTVNGNTVNLFYEVAGYTDTYVSYQRPTVTFAMNNVANGTLGMNAFSGQSGLTYSVGSVTGGGTTEPTLTGTTVSVTNFNITYNGATFTFDTPELKINIHTQADMTTAANYVCVHNVQTTRATVQCNGTNLSNGSIVKIGDTITVSYSGDRNKSTTVSVFDTNNASGSSSTLADGTTSYTIPANNISINATSSTSCVTEGSLITLADGTKKKVEDLTLNDRVLVFNHETGKYETAKINFIENDGRQEYEVVYLYFSDGTSTGLISEHGYFDLDLMKYVYVHAYDAHNYIGHRFYKGYLDGTYSTDIVTLTDVVVKTEYIGCYSLTTDYHLNFFVDDLLSMPGGIQGMFNFFDYDEDLKYNEAQMKADIEKYGLCTYEDFAEYFSYETYLKYPAAYIKVALGKGLMTEDDLLYLIERYAKQYGN